MSTFAGKEIKNGTKVQNINLVLYGEHHELNEEGMTTPVNLGYFSVKFENGNLQFDNAEFDKQVSKALRAILLTFIMKQSKKED